MVFTYDIHRTQVLLLCIQIVTSDTTHLQPTYNPPTCTLKNVCLVGLTTAVSKFLVHSSNLETKTPSTRQTLKKGCSVRDSTHTKWHKKFDRLGILGPLCCFESKDLTFFPEKFQVGSLKSSFFQVFLSRYTWIEKIEKDDSYAEKWPVNLSPSPKRTNHPEIRAFFRAYCGQYLDGPRCLVEYGPSNRPFLSDEVAKALCPIARELQRRGQEVQIALSRSWVFFATFGENSFSLQFYQMMYCINHVSLRGLVGTPES